MSIEALACVATAAGAHERAATLFGAAEPIWHTSAMLPRRISNRISRSAASASRTALGDTAFDAAFRAGAMLDRAETLAFALDERAARPRTPPTETAGMLTRREVQVARLIADGLSNRDISAKLVISLRTAEAHAEHIRTKLGFTSRSQIAAWIASGDHAN